ncbi:RhuM family protein, partial [Eikenella corrodens]|nr:RhuM family protein [Eikenella corrodens]
MNNPIEIYQSADGQTQVEVRFDTDTVWLSQSQMVTLFGRNQSVISRHINNAIAEGEINEKSNMQKMHIASADRPVTFYDLETIISVGYRIKSAQGIAFRRWATARLKDYLLKGYALNQQRLQQNADELEQALQLIQTTAASPALTLEAGRGLVDIVSRYTHTFLWLQQYDEGLLQEPAGENGGSLPTPEAARQALSQLKAELIARGEASDLFARERED